MHLDTLRDYCLAKHGAWEDLPFDEDTLVFKVGKKMFGMIGLERIPLQIGLKCDPERAPELRSTYEGIHDGPYLRGIGWNYVELKSDVPNDLIRELIDLSYDLVVKGMTKVQRAALEATSGDPTGQ